MSTEHFSDFPPTGLRDGTPAGSQDFPDKGHAQTLSGSEHLINPACGTTPKNNYQSAAGNCNSGETPAMPVPTPPTRNPSVNAPAFLRKLVPARPASQTEWVA